MKNGLETINNWAEKNKSNPEFHQMIEWPEIFKTENLDGLCDAKLCADGLMAWGNCHLGLKRPESFGRVLMKIGLRLGISPTGEELMKWSARNIKTK